MAWKVVLYFSNRASICSHALILLSPSRWFVLQPFTKHVWIVVLVVYKRRVHPVFQTRLECGSLSAYTHKFPALCFKHVLRRGAQTLGAVTGSLMILLTPRPSSCVPGTQSFNGCFPTKHHTEDGPRFSFSVAWRVSSSSSRTGSLMSLLSVHMHLSPALFKHV